MRDLNELFTALSKSAFRSRFKLSPKDLRYLNDKGFGTIEQHARNFIRDRLAPADPPNDGKQTPMKNHPVFIAQHATATCCRKCLKKWHHIPTGIPLDQNHTDYITAVIMHWIKQSCSILQKQDFG